MQIRGYETDPLTPGERLLEHPGFWAAYLHGLCETQDEDIPEPEAFGIDPADFEEACLRLYDAEAWPVFRIPFGDGHEVVVLCRNLDDDMGLELFVRHPEWDRVGELATLDGHQAGPGLAWRELVHIAAKAGMEAENGVGAPEARLLLLLPSLGDADLPGEAKETVTAALTAVGMPEDLAPDIARRLLVDHPMWEPATWEEPGEGSAARILQCDEPMSPRHGIQLAQGITEEQSGRLARALGSRTGSGTETGKTG